MSEPDTSKWEKAVSALKAAQPDQRNPDGRQTQPSPEDVEQIVRVAKQRRKEWIQGMWQSLVFRALAIAAIAIGIAALFFWNRGDPDESSETNEAEKSSPIIPAPAMDDLESIGKPEEKETP